MQLPIYLDYAATTPVDPRVAQVMIRHLTQDGSFGNPASTGHAFGQTAQRAVEQARQQVATLIHADPKEIIWTSGATESTNLALKGVAQAHKGRHLVTCKTEHRATLDVCNQLERQGYRVSYLDPQPNGLLDLQQLADTLQDDTVLVSIMHVNNEIGVSQDLAAIGQLTRSRGVLLHVDAAQSVGKIPIDVRAMNIDLMSLTAHKLYGPKGIGALYVQRLPRVRLTAQIHGGGQERGLRAGTLPTHQIVGMGEACHIASLEMASENDRIRQLRDHLWRGLQELGAVLLNGDPDQRVAGILNVSFSGISSESLLMALKNLALSSSSACSSANSEPSHVLRALGLSDTLAGSAIRFSIGRFTTTEEIDFAVTEVHCAVNRLRELSPLWELQQAGLDPDTVQWETFAAVQ
ncbi:MAG: IscS subfamily cysteine desulfurase [Candidatus Competibacteraceae bacterium]|jgi:cysteine desulfurase|nr:IscS subfamily cysteine desulfurase [Candidatus Competibacteraceae bacterium]